VGEADGVVEVEGAVRVVEQGASVAHGLGKRAYEIYLHLQAAAAALGGGEAAGEDAFELLHLFFTGVAGYA
jgi:hypothetical protein